MAVVIIKIEQWGNCFHAQDAKVQTNDTVIISTDVQNQQFKVVVPNQDGFFNSSGVISGTIDSITTLGLGNVTGNGKATKYYTIDPSCDAPPRIIRVS
jgi:hypothetical protein